MWYCESNTPVHMKKRRDEVDTNREEVREIICFWSAADAERVLAYLDYIRMELRCGRRKHLMSPMVWMKRRFGRLAAYVGRYSVPKSEKGSLSRHYFLKFNLDSGSMSCMTSKAHYDNDVWICRQSPGTVHEESIMDGYMDYLAGAWGVRKYIVPLAYWKLDVWRSEVVESSEMPGLRSEGAEDHASNDDSSLEEID